MLSPLKNANKFSVFNRIQKCASANSQQITLTELGPKISEPEISVFETLMASHTLKKIIRLTKSKDIIDPVPF
jgi:glycerol-3-phosphate O-acyltransferase